MVQGNSTTDQDKTSSVSSQQFQSRSPSGTGEGESARPESNPLPAVTLPKGGGALRGIDEKFSVNPATGTASLSVPIFTSPGRQGFGPELTLSYDSGGGNGVFGLGWDLSIPSITRKTAKGLPLYRDHADSDTFILSGAEDLVPVLDQNDARQKHDRGEYEMERYRPRTEGLFARIERWVHRATGEVHWRSVSKENITSVYGFSAECRVADPDDKEKVFQWLLEETFDARGNVIRYQYKQENNQQVATDEVFERRRKVGANRYIKRIFYGNKEPAANNQPPLPGQQKKPWEPYDRNDWLFELVFDYGEHGTMATFGDPWNLDPSVITEDIAVGPNEDTEWDSRPDPFSTYRAGFEQRTHRLCRRVLMFHRMQVDEHSEEPCLVRSTDFDYDRNEVATKLVGVTQTGYVRYRKNDGELRYRQRSLPPIEYQYSEAEISDLPSDFDPQSLKNLPQGVDGSTYRWVDLDGEGIPGVLTEQGGTWHYCPNLGNGRLGPMRPVDPEPSLDSLAAGAQLVDLGGDGKQDCVTRGQGTGGFYERTDDGKWRSFRSFTSTPNVDWQDPNLRLIDLTGDGLADILITEHEVFVWHPSKGKEGYAPSEYVSKQFDEEKGPAVVFADLTQSVFLADMSGDGLVDIARIRNTEVCYWPNLGYGHFGAKVTMGRLPESDPFDYPDAFDAKRIRLADTDGSGTTDLLYLRSDGIDIYLNQSGNTLYKTDPITNLPGFDNLNAIDIVDVLGKGTACLLWSSSKPADAERPMKYVDLMAAGKPHLLIKSCNNMGRENLFHYASSTRFYLEHKQDGQPWITRLPFPVHLIERVETYDRISRNRFVTRYAYHHGYFDGHEREFRGFGMVEQWDTEEIGALAEEGSFPTGDNIDESSYVPPTHTKTWFHTGAYLEGGAISRLYEKDYYREGDRSRGEEGLDPEQLQTLLLDDTLLPDDLSAAEAREACRALRGSILRQEIYADDETDAADRPYSVSERNYTVKTLQGIGANKHGVFFTHPRETIDFHYERELVPDPRVSHQLALAVDGFGNVEREVAVGYGRRDLPGVEEPEQRETHVTLTVNRFANESGRDDWYRVGMPAEARTFEIVKPPAPTILDSIVEPYSFTDIETLLEGSTDPVQPTEGLFPSDAGEPDSTKVWPYEKWDWRTNPANAPADTRLRLIEHVRTYYRSDNLDGQLALGQADSLALPFESYKLAFTPELLSNLYSDRVSLELLQSGGYVHGEGDEDWWIPSGRVYYASDREHTPPAQELDQARTHFYLPHRFDDPFGNPTTVEYDDLKLLVRKTEDALHNCLRAEEDKGDGTVELTLDYRVLQPWLVTDPNGNRSQVAFDMLGMVAATAVMGKVTETKGDVLAPNLALDPTRVDLERCDSSPRAEAASFLGTASSRVLYDLWRYYRTSNADPPDPVYAATIVRETHVADLAEGQESALQVSLSYSDGFGREIQKKIQAEPGPLSEGGESVPRWVGSGWTIFNNKGNPVRQYEPFFSDTHTFEFEKKQGVSPVLFYDPVERVIATLHPNDTYEKVLFDPWQQATYDVNDTVALDPRSDPDIKGYVEKYCASLGPDWKTWLQQHNVDPDNPPPDTNGAEPERDAAVRTLQHADTPTLTRFDSLGRTFLTVADNGADSTGNPQKYHTRIVLDIEGNQREVIDAKDRVVMRYDYDLLGNRIHQASMEAGERWMLNDVTGKPIRSWDGRGHNFATAYDQLRRPIAQQVRGTNPEQSDPRTLNKDIVFAKTEYGKSSSLNHRNRVLRQYDGAGKVLNVAYDFKGNLLEIGREIYREIYPVYKEIIDWASAPPEGADSFYINTIYDALNRPVSLIATNHSVIRLTYNEANLLNALEAKLSGDRVFTNFVTNIDYNAKGQRVRIDYATEDGAGISTTYNYDRATFRLTDLYTRRGAAFNKDCENPDSPPDVIAAPDEPPANKRCGLQNLRYTYDPAGNITHIRDDAQQTIYFRNQCVEPSNDYKYDAIYRLIQATGREHLGQAGEPIPHSYNDAGRVKLPQPGDCNAMGRYCEDYLYDEVGNILEMTHRRSCPGVPSWTRTYAYSEPSLLDAGHVSNRLTSTTIAGVKENYSTQGDGYDAHGNMLHMPHLQEMRWDFQDRLLMTQRQKVNDEDEEGLQHQGEKTYYVYDASGQRVRKVTERHASGGQAATKMKEHLYVFGLEWYHEYDGNGETMTFARTTRDIVDGKQRIALVETRLAGDDGSPAQLIRYQLGNHLGSAGLELDRQAKVISYEEYTPYGSTSYQAVDKEIKAAAKRYRYTGKERDEESGLYYYGARYYTPWLGSWTCPDPKGVTDGMNLYCFVRMNPIKNYDLEGTSTKSDSDNIELDWQAIETTPYKELEGGGFEFYPKGEIPLLTTEQLESLQRHHRKLNWISEAKSKVTERTSFESRIQKEAAEDYSRTTGRSYFEYFILKSFRETGRPPPYSRDNPEAGLEPTIIDFVVPRPELRVNEKAFQYKLSYRRFVYLKLLYGYQEGKDSLRLSLGFEADPEGVLQRGGPFSNRSAIEYHPMLSDQSPRGFSFSQDTSIQGQILRAKGRVGYKSGFNLQLKYWTGMSGPSMYWTSTNALKLSLRTEFRVTYSW